MPPWERYQTQAPQDPQPPPGPWAKYAGGDPSAMAQSAASSFRDLPGPSAAAGQADQPKPDTTGSTMGDMYRADQEYQIAARQSTSPDVRDTKGDYLRKPLGEGFELDDGFVWYKGADGQPQRADKAKNVVLRDPATDKLMVFDRSPETDQNKLLSLGQVITPGLVTSPLTGLSRAAEAANAPTRAAAATGRAQSVAEDAAAFDRAGVRPFGPAFSEGPVAATAKQVTEVPWLGAPARNALEESLQGAKDATGKVAARYGSATTAREAGQVAQEGIERFKDARPADVLEDSTRNLTDAQLSEAIAAPASATSLKAKQAALYERAWRQIPQEMQRGRAVEGQARVMGNPQNTRSVLEDIVSRNIRMTNQAQAAREGSDAVANPVRGGLLGRMIEAVRNPRWTANLQTLRDMRSEFRRLASGMGDTERNTLKLSDLDRIQGALTEDMISLLQRNADSYKQAAREAFMRADSAAEVSAWETAAGFERSIREFRRADQFTRLSMERLDTIEKLFRADSAESLSRNITNAALAGGRGNEQMLATLRRTLRPEEMGDIASSIISELGRPTGSARGAAQGLGFSVESFLTRWQNMSPRAKALLFDGPHRSALDDLVRVNSRLANVEGLANRSRTASNALGIGAIAAGGAQVVSGGGAGIATLLGSAGATYGAALLFSRPSYVKWVMAYTRAKAAARNPANMGSVIAEVNRLGTLARSDPALRPVYRIIAQENGVVERLDGDKQENQDARGK